MREKHIEKTLMKRTTEKGGLCLKFTSPGFRGVPDRIVLLPGGRLIFIELKAPGKVPRKLQKTVHGMLRDLGFKVAVIDSPDEIEGALE